MITIKDSSYKVLLVIQDGYVKEFSGRALYKIDGNDVKDMSYRILYRFDGGYITNFGGQIQYIIDGYPNRTEKLVIMACLLA